SLSFASFFFLYYHPLHRFLHSFPTRRSSDLAGACPAFGPIEFHRVSVLANAAYFLRRPLGHRALGRILLSRPGPAMARGERRILDRKSTRLNSSHRTISYAVFCLKKKKKKTK